jgi:subtilase family serine protease
MTLQNPLRCMTALLVAALFVGGSFSARAMAETNVPAGIQISKDLGLADAGAEINITVHLKLTDKSAFDKAVDALYDPASPTFHKWMTNADLQKFAPPASQRQAVERELKKNGLTILSTDKIGFAVRARGTLGNVERAFNTEIHQFEYHGSVYRANVRDARLSGEAGNYVSTVAGIESHQVRPMVKQAINPRTLKPYAPVALNQKTKNVFPAGSTTQCLSASATYDLGSSLPTAVYTGTGYSLNADLICDYIPSALQAAYGLNDVYAAGYTGKGQTVVLVEGYGYPSMKKDANTFYKLAGLPLLTPSNFSIIYPEGKPAPDAGILTGWEVEIALDMQSSHSVAPGANMLVVATNGQDSEDFQYSIEYVADNNLGNSISNSYEEDLDLLAGPYEQTSWDQTLEIATAKGISVNFSSGDGGDDGLGTPLGAPGVPSVAPHATSVGGTSILNDVNNPGGTITTVWGDMVVALDLGGGVADPPIAFGFQGGGGGGESVYWPKPAWQSALPGKGRQTPDVSALADPYTGFAIVVTEGGTQYLEFGWGGTSLASPIFTGFWALANEKAGSPLGQAGPLLAGLPYGAIQDVLPKTDSTLDDVQGSITDSGGTTSYSAAQVFAGLLYGNKYFTSAVWPIDPSDIYAFGFGLDTSLTVTKGWDNATGFGTPYGLSFIEAVAKAAKKK